MTFNVSEAERLRAGFKLAGQPVAYTDTFRYLGNWISASMGLNVASQQAASLAGKVWEEKQKSRVRATYATFEMVQAAPQLGMTARRQVLSSALSAGMYGVGVMTCRPWEWLQQQQNDMYMRVLDLPRRMQGSFPRTVLWGELGYWPLGVRRDYELVRVWAAVLRQRSEQAGAYGLFQDLVSLAEQQVPDMDPRKRGNYMTHLERRWRYTWPMQVKAALMRLGLEGRWKQGLPPGQTFKEYAGPRAAALANQVWVEGMMATRMVKRHYLRLVSSERIVNHGAVLKPRDYLQHRNKLFRIIMLVLRAGTSVLRDRLDFMGQEVEYADRICLMPGCASADTETARHFLMECPYWTQHRLKFELSVVDNGALSKQVKEHLGRMADEPERWYRMMMCCDLEVPDAWADVYGQTLSELKLVITRSKQGDADARLKVDTARRVLRDKQIILALLSKAMVPWYGARLKLAGKSLQRVQEW